MGISHREILIFYLLMYGIAVASIAIFRSIQPRAYFVIGICANIALFVIYAFFFKKNFFT